MDVAPRGGLEGAVDEVGEETHAKDGDGYQGLEDEGVEVREAILVHAVEWDELHRVEREEREPREEPGVWI